MAPAKASCVAILIHGIGNQKKDWSGPFRNALNRELGGDSAKVRIIDAYWAPASTLRELLHPTLAATVSPAATIEDETYMRTAREFARMLAADGGAHPAALTFGAGDLLEFIKKKLAIGEDLISDVGNYVARNGVRTAVQEILHEALGDSAGALDNQALIVSHSQGTIISYDVLRQAGRNYAGLRTWITMGSPLRKYLAFPLQWGAAQLSVPDGLRWLNLYDKRDIVGKDLAGAVDWQHPQPIDVVVDNVKNASSFHDHWANPQVVKAVAIEIRKLVQ
jgi:hypothetical protein